MHSGVCGLLKKHPTAILAILQVSLLLLLYWEAAAICDLVRFWSGPAGTEPSNGLVFCDVCDIAWECWFVSVPLVVGLIMACALVHTHLIDTHRRIPAKVLAYGTICTLIAVSVFLACLGSAWWRQLPPR